MKLRKFVAGQIISLILLFGSIFVLGDKSNALIVVYNFIILGIMIYFLRNVKVNKVNYKYIVIYSFVWNAGLMINVVMDCFHWTFVDSELIMLLFIGASNIIMSRNLFIYFRKLLFRWDKTQLVADLIVLTILILGLASGLFFSKMVLYDNKSTHVIISTVMLSLCLVTTVILLALATSLRKHWRDLIHVGTLMSHLMYIPANILIFNSNIVGLNYNKNFSYVLITLSIVIFMNTLIHRVTVFKGMELVDTTLIGKTPDNQGRSYFPVILIVIASGLFLAKELSTAHYIVMLVFFIVYMFFNNVNQRSINRQFLLEQANLNNRELEMLVEQRTMELVEINKKLEYEATRDSLTGLFNRKYFNKLLEEKIKFKQEFTLFFVDLDRFKNINDIHGHEMGDRVIIEISRRFMVASYRSCEYARFGGDEFVIVMDNTDEKFIKNRLQGLSDLIGDTIAFGDLNFKVSASIGVARFPDDAKTRKELFKYADIAMYYAKRNYTEAGYALHSSTMVEQVERRNYLELLLKKADFDKEFQLFYQPQFTVIDKKLVGMEALLRWNSDEEGLISPAEFIPLAEDIGLIQELSDWVFKTGMKRIKSWNETYHKNLVMHLNVSPVSLDNIQFLPTLFNMISEIDLPPTWLGFEITEHSAMSTATQMEEFLTALSGLGVAISIDDFGTGYSSLSYLKRFKINVIKIAKELVDNIENDHNDLLIVKAIIMMSKGMGIETLAEGVETKEQLLLLKEHGCDKIQGYYYGRPEPAEEFEKKFLVKKKLSENSE